MREDSGNDPNEPHIVPAQPRREPLPAPNGPVRPATADRIVAGAPSSGNTVPAADQEKKPPEQKDAFREIVETVVFVVVLVLLLKAFLAEAFVIPTGSMATTLLGYHRDITCPQCQMHFPLNLSKEMDAQEPTNERITGCICPNCDFHIDLLKSPEANRGP
jgi:hypothetical protein